MTAVVLLLALGLRRIGIVDADVVVGSGGVAVVPGLELDLQRLDGPHSRQGRDAVVGGGARIARPSPASSSSAKMGSEKSSNTNAIGFQVSRNMILYLGGRCL